MSDQQPSTTGILTFSSPVIMLFPCLFEPKKIKVKGRETGELKFWASFLLSPTNHDLATVKATIQAVCAAKWPGRSINADLKEGKFSVPLIAGNKEIVRYETNLKAKGKEYTGQNDFMKDQIILKTSSKFQPKLAVLEGGKVSPDLEGPMLAVHKGKFFFGAEVVPQINLVAYDGVPPHGVDGVTAYLNAVLVFHPNSGKRLTGGAPMADTFAAFAGKVVAEDPTEGMSDEIPF